MASSSFHRQVRMWTLPVDNPPDGSDASAEYPGGTSGIIVDNASSQPQASSIYFGTLNSLSLCSNKTCAVKLTQSTLE